MGLLGKTKELQQAKAKQQASSENKALRFIFVIFFFQQRKKKVRVISNPEYSLSNALSAFQHCQYLISPQSCSRITHRLIHFYLAPLFLSVCQNILLNYCGKKK